MNFKTRSMARVIANPLLGALLLSAGFACGSPEGPPAEATGGASGGSGGTGATGGSAGQAGSAGSTPFSCTSSGAVAQTTQVPAGEFIMGCNAAVDDECADDELPMRSVKLAAFEIDLTEVTQDQYAACVLAGACPEPACPWDCAATSLPAPCVTREAAISYCSFVGKRLPTEAEWEKAARGNDGRKFPWGNAPADCTLTNMAGCVGARTPVGSYPAGASPYGVLDMAGNMVEMLADWYEPAYYAAAPNVDPKGPPTGERYVGRGGGWKSLPFWHRASVRDWYDPPDFGERLGFRCAR